MRLNNTGTWQSFAMAFVRKNRPGQARASEDRRVYILQTLLDADSVSVRQFHIVHHSLQNVCTATIAAGLANDVQRWLVANQMGHSGRTADMYYTSLAERRLTENWSLPGNEPLRQKRLNSEPEDPEPETLTLPRKRASCGNSSKTVGNPPLVKTELHSEMNRTPKQVQAGQSDPIAF